MLPHSTWLVLAFLLFGACVASSGYSLYTSLRTQHSPQLAPPAVAEDPTAAPIALPAPLERVRIQLGDYRELPGALRIEVKDIRRESLPHSPATACAQLRVDAGGYLVCGGIRTKPVGTNEYLVFVPIETTDCEYLIWHAYFTEESFSFVGIRASHINEHERWVELEVCVKTS